MTTASYADGVLSRRLSRLRSAAAPAMPRVGGDGHAAVLAATLGGIARDAVAVVESHHRVPIDRAALARLPVPIDADRPLVCLDLETTGLATGPGTLAFLVGLGTWDGERLTVRQLLLSDHAGEPALLALIDQALDGDGALVTYNGRSFDWPLLVARYRLHGRPPPPLAGHHDLLPVARQLWRPRLGDARLATIERGVCGVERADDLAGALVPERYFRYLRERRPELLRSVLEHNRDDIVTLGLLLGALGRLVGDSRSWREAHPLDLAGLGRALGRRGRLVEALGCVEAALASPEWQRGVVGGGPLARRLAADRAQLLARLGRREEALAAWLDIAGRGGPGAAAAWLVVARHREWVERDYGGAIDACNRARAAADRARLWGRPVPTVEHDVARRVARLRRRLAGSPASRADVAPRAA